MNNLHMKGVVYVFCIVFFCFVSTGKVAAQCSDITLNLSRTNPTCLSNGEIKVTLTGNDVANLKLDELQLSVTGAQNISWTTYPDNKIENLPAGSYTISLRAFCYDINDWFVASTTASITLTSSYLTPDAIVGVPRKTLNCKYTGMIPITVKERTGSAPFTITITDYPAEYATGQKTFTLDRPSISTAVTQQIENLPAGNYTFTVADACSYTQTLSATVGTMPQDFVTNMFYDNFHPCLYTGNDCRTVSLFKNRSSRTPDENHYFYDSAHVYFEVGLQLNNTGTIDWMPSDSLKIYAFHYTLPKNYKDIRYTNTGDYFAIHLRVKGTSCVNPLNNVTVLTPNQSASYKDLKCDVLSVRHFANNASGGVFCHPYRYRIIDKNNVVIKGWSGWINGLAEQFDTDIPYGSRIEYQDSDNDTWTKYLNSNPPPVWVQNEYLNPCATSGMTNGYFHSYFSLYFYQVDSIPAGTRFRYISGPQTPIHTDVTTGRTIQRFYPFSSDYSTSSYSYVPAGVYQFEVTLPGSGCTPQSVVVRHRNYYLKEAPEYDVKETCGGLIVVPKKGELVTINPTTSIEEPADTYFYIKSVSPSTIPIDRNPIGIGDTLFMPTTGTYFYGMSYGNSSGFCFSVPDTMHYVKTPFSLDASVTTAHVCEGGGIGFIRVAGMGGSGNYSYELYDNGTHIDTNTDGKFNYGSAGKTYKIRLIDNDPACAASYEQDVYMIDLGIAQIAYTSSASNTFCLDENINLKCITLGETTYEWSGPGITSVNKNQQNPVIAASDAGIGTHTYTIQVKPEGCGSVMTQYIKVTVSNCSGAQNDYVTVFINTTDSIDVLANDHFPVACTPVIVALASSPANGTATVVNNKIVFTTNVIGRDSLKYVAVCGNDGTYTEAMVYITAVPLPDNISKADCFIDPPKQQWGIGYKRSNDTLYCTYQMPVVGDIDGDGIVEILVCKEPLGYNVEPGVRRSNKISIFKGNDISTPWKTIQTDTTYSWNSYQKYAIVKTRINSRDSTIIVVAERDQYARAYDYNTGAVIWQSSSKYFSWSPDHVTPSFADLNADGIPEVLIYDKVYDSRTGVELCRAGITLNTNMGLFSTPVTADLYGTGLNIILGNQIFTPNASLTGMTLTKKITPVVHPSDPDWVSGTPTLLNGGRSSVVDMDLDGRADLVISTKVGADSLIISIADVITGDILASKLIFGYTENSYPFVGDIDGDKRPEIVFITNGTQKIFAYKYVPGNPVLQKFWEISHADWSGATSMTLFDFNNDGISEIIYRDETHLRIINGSMKSHITGNDTTVVYNLARIECSSGTHTEYPVVADVDGDGQAEIIIVGGKNRSFGNPEYGHLWIFKSNEPASHPWAPARKVWNQYVYNPLNVNEDLTVPRYPITPAIVFPGADGTKGTTDDVRPYNNFLQQQTTLNVNGTPLWLAPDIIADNSISSVSSSGNSVSITVGIINQGNAAIGSPVYVTLYKESVSSTKLGTGSANIQIQPQDTGYVTITIPDITPYMPVLNIVARINDDGIVFPYQEECDASGSELTIINPMLHLMMKKNATLNTVAENGSYPNPVAILRNEEVEYEITAVNANLNPGQLIITDTLPAYLQFIAGSATDNISPVTIPGTPPRNVLTWTYPGVNPMDTLIVKYKATPEEGVCASQPMFINRAWITASDTLYIGTNSTYHQGAGVGMVTFSAGLGGQLYNAEPQAVDYKTAPRAGIIVTPDEGYRFMGWSHDAYLSLRNETIGAQDGILSYDTLTISGNVELHAVFAPEVYPIHYVLHASVNAESNPEFYTIESQSITLDMPKKEGDVFIGWTGSNGDEPQQRVTIPQGSTGALELYANFLHSGREEQIHDIPEDDEIWAVKNELHIRTSKIGSVVKVYSTEGMLQKLHTIKSAGESIIKLRKGIYVVTLNNGLGKKIFIE